jgi:molecular chaperone GrpE
MTRKPLAGQPEGTEERRPAGAEERRPAGAPAAERRAPERSAEEAERRAREAERQAEQQVERDFDELLAETRRERDEYLELAKRTRADFDNYRKRVGREGKEASARGKAELARELIPALDNLERALRAAGIDPGGAEGDGAEAPSEEVSAHEALASGVALVYRELKATLERAGVEAYDPAGERFDPAWHEALSTRAEDGAEPGVVLETVEKGYRLNGQVLRAARVIVSE